MGIDNVLKGKPQWWRLRVSSWLALAFQSVVQFSQHGISPSSQHLCASAQTARHALGANDDNR